MRRARSIATLLFLIVFCGVILVVLEVYRISLLKCQSVHANETLLRKAPEPPTTTTTTTTNIAAIATAPQPHTGTHPQDIFPDKSTIIAAGMMRSGSTWQYAVITEILRAANISSEAVALAVGTHDHDVMQNYPTSFSSRVLIVKSHFFHEDLVKKARFIFTTHRDLRDVFSSLIRKNFLSCAKSSTRNYRSCRMLMHDSFVENQLWSKHAHYIQRYEEMYANKHKVVRDIIETMGLPLQFFNISDILAKVHRDVHVSRVGINNDLRDPFFFVASDHHSDHDEPGYYKSFLNPVLVDCITFQYNEWLTQHNYEVKNLLKKRPANCAVWARHHPFVKV
eukprot:TRINITY_DN5673_c0_g2_i1.p1 TRINITY_DN5673_c0_g2~~TRINITY_DN5673_c0_g2_i1.p1  ORF type:complete len:337 (+),score=67.18 TRINITY_DN5673_c0_g2_i1:80-1090(+)